MPDQPTATFFITTARSGTQWLATRLQDVYGDMLRVEHEPVGYQYRPAANLRDAQALNRLLDDPVVAAHLATVDDTLRTGRSYVEVGFPSFALYPLLRDRFGDQVRIVQLVRHPIRVAASLVTQRWYTERGRRDVQGTVALMPDSSGVLLRDYTDRWSSMTAFEKGLFYWYEVHAYGQDVAGTCPPDEFTRTRFVDLAEKEASREQLLAFLRLPRRGAFVEDPAETVDRFRHVTPEPIDISLIEAHPRIVSLAEAFGYDLAALAQDEIDDRYRASLRDRWSMRAGRVGRRLRRALRPRA